MKAYAVRHKPSGLFIPRLKAGRRRGGSHLEPSNDREPRLFFNKKSARSFLGQWLLGIVVAHSYQGYDGGHAEIIKIVPQPHRNKLDMEIVEFNLVEVK